MDDEDSDDILEVKRTIHPDEDEANMGNIPQIPTTAPQVSKKAL